MSRRIAIVEDEAAIRENYADVLRKQGYEVQTYCNREEAMSAFDLRLPNLAIIDIGLESEIDGGFALCQALRSLSDTLPIIFLTARDNDFDTVSGLRMGADDYLTKDISLPHLSARIAALFRRSDVIDQPTSPENLVERGRWTRIQLSPAIAIPAVTCALLPLRSPGLSRPWTCGPINAFGRSDGRVVATVVWSQQRETCYSRAAMTGGLPPWMLRPVKNFGSS